METPWTEENPFKISMKCWFQIDLKFLDQIKSLKFDTFPQLNLDDGQNYKRVSEKDQVQLNPRQVCQVGHFGSGWVGESLELVSLQ